MKRLLIPLFSIALWWSAAAQDKAPSDGGWWNENPSLVLPIRAVGVTGVKPMKEIGVQKTQLDTLVLHENIALSMADVLTFNSSIFIKQYGRATLSTVAFRGTGPSHTQVVWNGMRINSPMLGMTDFSMIPSYFVDDAQLLHGTSSVNVTGGGLGGAVMLATKPADTQGFGLQYTQGIGSFWTTDEFLRLTYGNDRWQTSTRVVYSSSPNEYSYRNHDKKENIYDDEHNIIGSYYPREKHDDGAFRDFHLLQEAYYNTGNGDRFGLNAWLIASKRGLGRMTTDYGDPKKFINEQRERTLRSVLSWDHLRLELESRGQGRIHLQLVRLRLRQRRGQRETGVHDHLPELVPHALRLGRRGVLHRPQMALHGTGRPAPAFRHEQRPQDHLAGHEPKDHRIQPRAHGAFDQHHGQMDAHRTAGAVRHAARRDVRRAVDAAHPGVLCGLPDLETRDDPGKSLRIAQLPLSHAQRPLFPTGREHRPRTRIGVLVRRRDIVCRREGRGIFAARRGDMVRFLHRRLDSSGCRLAATPTTGRRST